MAGVKSGPAEVPSPAPPASSAPPYALYAAEITHSFGERAVLRGVSLGVRGGEVVAVTGPSGSGKSTLLHLLGGLDTPGSGEVWWGETRVDTLGTQARASLRASSLGFVFQHHYLLEDLSVAENLEVPLLLAGQAGGHERVQELLDAVGLGGRGHESTGVLSGGERQRIAIARALASRPRALLADEPTGSLDRQSARAAAGLMFDLARRQGTGVLLVTHDEALAEQADRRLHLVDGVLSA
ncbi:Sulfate-transporting ATPase [Deinococcus proteolyticus MRP]|uniref:Sulfate-transporting ATPase n=1 Tax=Deinococcus proteolyticus (strain ATCC 35074 / DSM 20540 / JCM 6276 / NBRC 101906 / NCIMB 13154 / VKM Ac-1939 / CCM 2703 / MRP) TaxID=693977 RepID=F0RL23_DEIPM|nr:Sulfate-transporting ATPase [Deinococcus proteolyticus MRP]